MISSISVKRFLRNTRAGATAIAAAAATIMAVGGAALITDHVWLVDQRDVLKSAAPAASVATTHEMSRRLFSDDRAPCGRDGHGLEQQGLGALPDQANLRHAVRMQP